MLGARKLNDEHDIIAMNVAEGPHRSWADCRKYGFLSAGNGPLWRDQILKIAPGTIVVAYLNGAPGNGFVGVGRVTSAAVPVSDFVTIDGAKLVPDELEQPGLFANADDQELSEYLIGVEWIVAAPSTEARWEKNANLATTRHVFISLSGKENTLQFLENTFQINFADL